MKSVWDSLSQVYFFNYLLTYLVSLLDVFFLLFSVTISYIFILEIATSSSSYFIFATLFFTYNFYDCSYCSIFVFSCCYFSYRFVSPFSFSSFLRKFSLSLLFYSVRPVCLACSSCTLTVSYLFYVWSFDINYCSWFHSFLILLSSLFDFT